MSLCKSGETRRDAHRALRTGDVFRPGRVEMRRQWWSVLRWSWRLNPPKMYPRFNAGPHKDKYVHRVVFEQVAGRPIRDGFVVAHSNGNKRCFCPHNLVECPPEFNPAPELRDPYTGWFVNREWFKRNYGA